MTNNRNTVQALRELADLIEGLPEDSETAYIDSDVRFVCDNAEEMMVLRRAIGGEFKKLATNEFFRLVRKLPGGGQAIILASRGDVCERVVTGTEMVLGQDPDAPQVLIEKEIVQWVCPEVLQ